MYFVFALFNDIFDSENSGDAEVNNFDNILFFAIENYILEFEVWVENASSMAMGQDIKDLVHDVSGSSFRDRGFLFNNGGKRLPKTKFHNNKVSVTVLKKLINFIDEGVINLFKFINLLFEGFSFISPHLVLIDDIDRTDEFGLDVNGFAQFVKLVFLEVRWKDLVLSFDRSLDLSNEVVLLEFNLLFVFVDLVGGLL